MLRRQFLGWQLAAMLGLCAAGHAQEPSRKPDTDRNAALLYWQAFARLSELPPAERSVIDYYPERWYPDREKAPTKVKDEIFQKTAGAANIIHRAVRMPRCVWEEDFSEEWAPHVQMCRSIGRFLAFRAGYEIEHGQPRAAADDLLAGFTLSQHAAADNTINGVLVGVAIEGIIEDESLEHLQQMDAAALDAFQSGLDRIPPRSTWKMILAQDKRRLHEWLIPQFAATSDPDAWKATLRRMYPDAPKAKTEKRFVERLISPDSPKVKREPVPNAPQASELIERFGTREALVRHLQEGDKLLDELAQFPFPPPGKISEPLRTKLLEMRKHSPLLYDNCSLQDATHFALARAVVQFLLLRAAIAVQRHGPEALKDYPDPSGDGPFEYRKHPGGFELVSQLRLPWNGWERFSVKVGPLAKGEARFRSGISP
jgi:hypothetical protein